MRPVTLQDAEASVRAMCGTMGTTAQPEVLRSWLKEATEKASAALDWIEDHVTFDSDIGEDTYSLPDDIVRIEYVTWDGYRMSEINRRKWSELSDDGQDDTTGDPCHYLYEEGKLVLYPVPDEAKEVIVRYRRKPTRTIREHKAAASGGSTTTVVDSSFPLRFGIVNNRENEETTFFNGCLLRISQDAGGTHGAPEGEQSVVTSYNEATGTFTVDPPFSAAVASGDYYELQDVLEISPTHTAICQYYAAARLLQSSSDPADVSRGDRYQTLWTEGLETLRSEAWQKSRTPDRMMRIYEV